MFEDNWKDKVLYLFINLNTSLIYFGLGVLYLVFTYNTFEKIGFIFSLILLALYCIGFLLSQEFGDDDFETFKKKKFKDMRERIKSQNK